MQATAKERGLQVDVPLHPVCARYCALLEGAAKQPWPVVAVAHWALEAAYHEAWRGHVAGMAQPYATYAEVGVTPVARPPIPTPTPTHHTPRPTPAATCRGAAAGTLAPRSPRGITSEDWGALSKRGERRCPEAHLHLGAAAATASECVLASLHARPSTLPCILLPTALEQRRLRGVCFRAGSRSRHGAGRRQRAGEVRTLGPPSSNGMQLLASAPRQPGGSPLLQIMSCALPTWVSSASCRAASRRTGLP